MKNQLMLLLTAAFCLGCMGCAQHSAAPAEAQTSGAAQDTGSAAPETTVTEAQTAAPETTVTEAEVPEPEQIAEHMYRVQKLPEFGEITQSYEGTAYYDSGLKTTIHFNTVDFSDYASGNCNVTYWLSPDQSVMYFSAANGEQLYRSDPELHDPKLLFSNPYEFPDQENIRKLYLFPGQKKICFLGMKANNPCIGTLDPDTGETVFIPTADGSELLSNSGVLFYDNWGRSKTVQYWEDGTIYRFDLQNKKEASGWKYISPNGKYLCTTLAGKTKDGFLTERYSLYSIKEQRLMTHFDMVYETKDWNGAAFLGFDEDAQRVYLEHVHAGKFDFIEYRFGEE